MSSESCGNSTEDGEIAPPVFQAPKSRPPCIRCKSQSASVRSHHNFFCKECFVQFCQEKFRIGLCTAHVVKPRDNVIVALSGGTGSRCALEMLHWQITAAPKPINVNPIVVHVDESAALSHSLEERDQYITELKEAVASYRHPFVSLPLESVLEMGTEILDAVLLHTGLETVPEIDVSLPPRDRIRRLFERISTLTVKEDILELLRMRALAVYASTNRIKTIILGATADSVASNIMSCISKGRPSSVMLLVNHADKVTFEPLGVQLVRPLKDVLLRSAAFYARFRALKIVFIPNWSTKKGPKASLNQLSEAFLQKLQSSHVDTVATIMRTGAKLVFPDFITGQRCSLCSNPLFADEGSLRNRTISPNTARELAAKFSQKSSKADQPSTADGTTPIHSEASVQRGECESACDCKTTETTSESCGTGVCSTGVDSCCQTSKADQLAEMERTVAALAINEESSHVTDAEVAVISEQPVAGAVCYACERALQECSPESATVIKAIARRKVVTEEEKRQEIAEFLIPE